MREANFLIDNYEYYNTLKQEKKVVDIMIALSIFHKRVISCLDGADKFYGTITKNSEARTIRIGTYSFTGQERNNILGVLINYRALIAQFRIPESTMDYDRTKEFLKKLMYLKYSHANPQDNSPQNSKEETDKKSRSDYDDLPF